MAGLEVMQDMSSNDQRTALERITGVIGWIGTLLVFGAVAVRFLRPEWNQYATWAAWAGLGAVVIYMAGQWREVAGFYKGRQARYGTVSIVGTGMASAPGYAARLFRTLFDRGINIELISTSDIRITCLVRRAQVAEAVRALHEAFALDRE